MNDQNSRLSLLPLKYPLISRIATGLFQGISRSGMLEADLPIFLLGFFRVTELLSLRREISVICEINASDEEWRKFWSTAGAMSFPDTAEDSKEFLRTIEKNIKI